MRPLLERFTELEDSEDTVSNRPLYLTQMVLTCYVGHGRTLTIIKKYWLVHFERPTCFSDLRRILSNGSDFEKTEFHYFVYDESNLLAPGGAVLEDKVCRQRKALPYTDIFSERR